MHIYAFCKAQGVRVVHPFFEEYLSYFPNLPADKNIVVLKKGFLRKLFIFFLKNLIRVMIRLRLYNLGFLELIVYERCEQEAPFYNLHEETFRKKAKGKIVLLYGWLFRDFENYSLQAAALNHCFAIGRKYQDEAIKIIGNIKRDGVILVGVHVRRGDYKTFEGGKWYYSDEIYKKHMQLLELKLRKHGKNICFIICSNEKIDIDNYEPLKACQASGSFIIDFLLLSKCDYVIGPPSTFSELASKYGNNQLSFIVDGNSYQWIDQFSSYQFNRTEL
jgi:hypothetical protein